MEKVSENMLILLSLGILLKHARDVDEIRTITDCLKIFEIKNKDNPKLRIITKDIYNEIHKRSCELSGSYNND